MRVEFLDSTTPLENAACEEHFFRARPFDEEPRLFFYTNSPCVQYGRNQNPLCECDTVWCAEQGIPVIQRISGGGTVWHDLGNQNYAFILPRSAYSPDKVLTLVVESLQAIGVADARFCSRYSVWHGEYKISGSAFALSGPAAMLHGCLPFTSDLARLKRALTPSANASQEPRKVASVVSPVANIAPLCQNPDTCRTEFCRILAEKAQAAFA